MHTRRQSGVTNTRTAPWHQPAASKSCKRVSRDRTKQLGAGPNSQTPPPKSTSWPSSTVIRDPIRREGAEPPISDQDSPLGSNSNTVPE
eukprot:3209209-Rhodomonas_salina.1